MLKPDECNVVILHKCDYQHNMEEILQDKTKFSPWLDDPSPTIKKHENKLRIFIKNFKKMVPSGSQPGILHGLPKVRKTKIH